MRDAPDWSEQWQSFKSTGDKAARDELALAYAPLVRSVAGRLQIGLPATVEFGDLVGYGMLGLLDAINKYMPSIGVKFETYAATRIRGAILDGLRAYDWAPRSLRQKARQVSQAIGMLEATQGRSATDAEIAAALNITVRDFEQILADLNGLALLSLHQPLDAGEESLGTLVDVTPDQSSDNPTASYEKRELHAALAAAIDALPERERLVVSLYYNDEMTLKEIGMILAVTESRVCQLHTRALLRLRARLEGYGEAGTRMAAGGD